MVLAHIFRKARLRPLARAYENHPLAYETMLLGDLPFVYSMFSYGFLMDSSDFSYSVEQEMEAPQTVFSWKTYCFLIFSGRAPEKTYGSGTILVKIKEIHNNITL